MIRYIVRVILICVMVLPVSGKSFFAINEVEVISNSEINVDIILPKFASKAEVEASNIFANLLAKTAKRGIIRVLLNDKYSSNSYKIYLRENPNRVEITPYLKDFDKAQEFIFDVGRSSATIYYPDKDSILPAIGEFLSRYFAIEILAPSPLAQEIPLYKNHSLNLGKEFFYPSYLGRFFGLYQPNTEIYASLNGQYKAFVMRNHNLTKVIDKAISKENPEWMAYFKGMRSSYDVSRSSQVDFLNEELRKYILNYTLDYFKENPDKKILSLTYADSGDFDQTLNTVSLVRPMNKHFYLDYSDVVFSLTNYVAKNIKKSFPKKFLVELAYLYTEKPPSFTLSDNIITYIAIDRANNYSPEQKKIDDELTKSWSKSGVKLFGLYDYNYGKPYFIPRNTASLIAEAIQDSYKAGAKLYVCETYPLWAYDIHKLWIMSKLLKDVNLDYDELLGKFYKMYYKEASAGVEEFFRIAEEVWLGRTDDSVWLKLLKRPSQAELFDFDDLNRMQKALDKANESAKLQIVKDRLFEITLAFDITKTFIRTYNLQKKLWSYEVVDNANAPYVLDTLKAFNTSMKLKEIYIDKYNRNTKYPKSDFNMWKDWDMLDPSNQIISQLLMLKDSSIEEALLKMYPEEEIQRLKSALDIKSAKNLLKNSGFEKNLMYWSIYKSVNASEKVELVFDEAKNDTHLKLSAVNAVGITQRAVVKPMTMYRASILVSGKINMGNLAYLRLIFSDDKGSVLKREYLSIPAMDLDKEKQMSLTTQAPAGATKISASFFVLTMHPSESINVDNFELLEFE